MMHRLHKDGAVGVLDNGTTTYRNPRVLTFRIDENNIQTKIIRVITGSSQSISSYCVSTRSLKSGASLVELDEKLDKQQGTFANGVSSTVSPNGVVIRILGNLQTFFNTE